VDPQQDPGQPGRIRDIRAYRPAFVGMVLLVCTLFLVFGAAAAYGGWVTLVLAVVWLVLFVLGCRWFASRPRRVALVGVLALAAWLVAAVVANLGG
jgi:hypothetical protein